MSFKKQISRSALVHFVILRYQKQYTENATPVTTKGSRIEDLGRKESSDDIEKHADHSVTAPSLSRQSSSNRELPKWMLRKGKSDQSNSSLDMSRSDSTSSVEAKPR